MKYQSWEGFGAKGAIIKGDMQQLELDHCLETGEEKSLQNSLLLPKIDHLHSHRTAFASRRLNYCIVGLNPQ